MPWSGVAKQRHEPIVHVLLDMAVKHRQASLVGYQIHRGASKCGNDDCILLDSGGGLAVELDKLEHMPVHVQRVSIVAAIVKHQTIAASLPQHELLFVRIFLAVDH